MTEREKAIDEMERDVEEALNVPICDDSGTVYGVRKTTSTPVIAARLISKGYRKLKDSEVIIDKDELPCYTCPVPQSVRDTCDCSTVCGSIQLGINWQNQCRVLVKELNHKEEEVRKELLKELADKAEQCGGILPLRVLRNILKEEGNND